MLYSFSEKEIEQFKIQLRGLSNKKLGMYRRIVNEVIDERFERLSNERVKSRRSRS